MKTGIIDVGGGMRGIYAAGVLDCLMEDGITFDVGIGVSAGSANIASFIAGQHKRNHAFYTEYSLRDEYMSRANIRSKGCFLDVKYIYGTLSNTGGENPFDFPAFCANPMEFICVGADVNTGAAKYFGKGDMRLNYYNTLMASSAEPYMCTPQEVNGSLYYDGDVADPVPLAKALAEGCDKVILILNEPETVRHDPAEDAHLASRIRDQYPRAADTLLSRAEKYNAGVDLARKLAGEGKVLIIAPDDLCGVGTLCRDREAMQRLYERGLRDGARTTAFLGGRPEPGEMGALPH